MKNYIVKMKSVKDIVKMSNYLINENHKNHKNTSEIIELTNNYEDFLKSNLEEEAEIEIGKSIKRKGGRPSAETALSFTLNFPKNYKVDKSQVQEINNLVLKDLADFLKIDIQELEKKSYAVQHVQENEHYHLLVSSVLNGKKNRIIRSRSALTFIKKSFTLHTDKVLGTSISNYQTTITKEETFDKQEVLIEQKKTILLIKKYIEVEEHNQNTKTVKFLLAAKADFEKGKSKNGNKKLDKYQKRLLEVQELAKSNLDKNKKTKTTKGASNGTITK